MEFNIIRFAKEFGDTMDPLTKDILTNKLYGFGFCAIGAGITFLINQVAQKTFRVRRGTNLSYACNVLAGFTGIAACAYLAPKVSLKEITEKDAFLSRIFYIILVLSQRTVIAAYAGLPGTLGVEIGRAGYKSLVILGSIGSIMATILAIRDPLPPLLPPGVE